MDFKERLRRREAFDASLVYGTREFNLITKRREHLDYRKKNDDHWIDQSTGLIANKFAHQRSCPLCASNNAETVFVKSGFPHLKCGGCSLTYVSPILSHSEYEKIWSQEDSWEDVLESPAQIEMQVLEAQYSLDIAQLYLKGSGRFNICDVGCGPGRLLSAAKKRGHYSFGIEPNKRCHSILQENGIDYAGDFFPLKKKIDARFDIMFLLNALEHLPEPLLTIQEAKKLLKPSGLIYISVPCIDALVNRIMHEKAGVFAGHSHIQFFNVKTLSLLLEMTGFEVLEYETIITELGVIKNYLSYKEPYFNEIADSLDFLTSEFLYKNHLARNINMVARLR